MATPAQIGALRVHLGLNSAQFTQGLKKSESRLDKFKQRLGGMKTILIGTVAAGFTAAGLAIRKFSAAADETIKSARALGMTAEQLSRLRLAARRGGVETKTLTTALRTFNATISDVISGGTSEGAKAFERLGISVTKLDGTLKNNRELLGEVADRFQAMPDGIQKSALAMDLFGARGANMINVLNQGSEGLARMDAEADKIGQTIGTKAALAAERFNDGFDRLTESMGGWINVAVAEMLPVLGDIVDGLFEFFQHSRLARDIGEAFAIVLKAIGTTGALVAQTFDTVITAIRALGGAMLAVAEGDFTAALKIMRDESDNYIDRTVSRLQWLQRVWDETARKELAASRRTQLTPVVDLRGGRSGGRASAPDIADLPDDVRKYKESLQEADEAGLRMVDNLASGLENAFTNAIKGTGDLKRDLLDLAINVIGGVLKQQLQSLAGGGGGGGGLLGGLFGGGGGLAGPIASLGAIFGTSTGSFGGASALFSGASAASSLGVLGFRNGGAFDVPGHGGPDSELAAFRVSPGENVAISKDGGGSGPSHITVDVSGANGDREIERRVQAGVQAGLQAYDQRLPGRLQDIDRRLA